MIKRNRTSKNAFALPTVLIASIIMLTVLLVSITSTAALRTAMTAQYYNKLTQASNDAGMAYAKACLASNNNIPQWNDTNKLKPDTDCSGIQLASCPVSPADADCHFVTVIGNVRSTFTVGLPEVYSSGMAKNVVVSASTNLLRTSDSSIWRSYSQSVGFTQNNNVLPFAPTGLTATGGVTLNWTAPTEVGNSAITGYRIYRSTSTNTESAYAIVGNVTTYTDTSVSGGTTYYYKVAAINSDGEGALSGEANRTVKTGVLAPLAPATYAIGTYPMYAVMSPDGAYFYVASWNGSLVYMYSRSTVNGTIAALGTPTIPTGSSVYGIAMSSDGKSVYVTDQTNDCVYMYNRNTGTGILTAQTVPTIAAGTNPYGIVVSSDGKSVYAVNTSSNNVSMYIRDTGTGVLTSAGVTTAVANAAPQHLAMSPDGANVYVTNGNSISNTISMFSRNSTNSTLTPIGTAIATGSSPRGISVSSDGKNVYATNVGGDSISMYTRDTGTGLLTALSTPISTGAQPEGIAISNDGLSVYATNNNALTLSMFNRNPATGVLTVMSPSTVTAGTSAFDVVISPDDNFAYTINYSSGNISLFSRS